MNARLPHSDDDAAGLMVLHRLGRHPSGASLIVYVCVRVRVCVLRMRVRVCIVREVSSPVLFLEAGDPREAAAQQPRGGGEGR